ncbi:hypothetical protein L249_1230 [Ophiocordyceps polyrhachis-furcata BCC 54312]|uniref:Uncharacterized protein n=1 Tax=Ophiocordyceps polyrhachis-furcata BCC 54312 TaxID=1330021 RepID=A0A367LDZ1_9HYPO|nr:hypothetical protein L249_1230 [Ophiocordyceps polyrhachis-furcata BCC 54312]
MPYILLPSIAEPNAAKEGYLVSIKGLYRHIYKVFLLDKDKIIRARDILAEGKRHSRKFDCLDRPPFLGSLTYPTFLPSYGPYGPYGPAVTYGGLGPAAAGPASPSVTYGGLGPAAAGPASPAVTYGGLGPAAAGPASRDPPRPSGRVPCSVWRSRQNIRFYNPANPNLDKSVTHIANVFKDNDPFDPNDFFYYYI